MTAARNEFAAVADYLFGLKPRGAKLGIDRMRLLADELGHPETRTPVVHIAGTNGKGSVAAMIEAVLRAAGWKVGLYTSPHLLHVGERVQVNRGPLTSEEVTAYVRELDVAADRVAALAGAEDRPSFFEYMTAMAFLQFARTRCDIAVMEVGLGGEFDATNIVTPEASVITSIGLDHCEYLGNTIEEIAATKAGIIKAERPVVLGRVPAEAEVVIRRTAQGRGATVWSVREIFGDDVERYPETNLAGEYQRWNAATAALVARVLAPRWRTDETTVARALKSVRWSGRWERTKVGERVVVLDASHNPEGAAVLERNLAQLARETGRKPIVVVGVLGADRAKPLLTTIAGHAEEIYLVVPNQPRATSYEELERVLPGEALARTKRATLEGIFPGGDVCALGGPNDVIVVTGSIYLLGEVMARLGRSV